MSDTNNAEPQRRKRRRRKKGDIFDLAPKKAKDLEIPTLVLTPSLECNPTSQTDEQLARQHVLAADDANDLESTPIAIIAAKAAQASKATHAHDEPELLEISSEADDDDQIDEAQLDKARRQMQQNSVQFRRQTMIDSVDDFEFDLDDKPVKTEAAWPRHINIKLSRQDDPTITQTYKVNSTKPLSKPFKAFAKYIDFAMEALHFMHQGKELNAYMSPKASRLNLKDLTITVAIKTNQLDEDVIAETSSSAFKIKIQSELGVTELSVELDIKVSDIIKRYARVIKKKPTDLRLQFDGDDLAGTSTLSSIDLDDDDMDGLVLDCLIKS
eukprot:TRINITY_DN10406_c0_g1_i1.p2 TRINITY_DN10406_c0_g1~~TRINITY_DN10406_c0_g1_i1.p2  ORF type:complete len:327 (+),score=88.08 TRINITY_DN10406_c0_g1_i1:47-1027(+)